MKITIEEIKNSLETEVVIKCKLRDDYVESIVASLRLFDSNVTAKKDGSYFLLSPGEIFYFESVDDKVYCYGEKEVYETSLRLYEIEEKFLGTTFLRVNKSMILNITKISEFKSLINGRMEAVLSNGEKVEISRNYVKALKILLMGIRK